MVESAARIFVTGMAASTCCGVGTAPLLARLRGNGRSAPAAPATERRFPSISNDISRYVRITRTEDELTRQILAAVVCDLEPGLNRLGEKRRRLGITLGNTSGSYAPYCRFYSTVLEDGPLGVNPAHLPGTLINYQTTELAHALDVMGENTTISSGGSAGLEAVARAATRLRLGRADAALAGGVQSLNPYDSDKLAQDPAAVPGEAVALLLLERGDAAANRAEAQLLGWAVGEACDGPPPRASAAATIQRALRTAGVDPEQVDIVAGSAGEAERRALAEVFGTRLETLALVEVRSLVGDCLAAAGPLQCLAAVGAIRHGALPMAARRPSGRHPTRAMVVQVGPDGTSGAVVVGPA